MSYTISCRVLNAVIHDGKGELLVEAGRRILRAFCSADDIRNIDVITGPYIRLYDVKIVKGKRPGLKFGSYEPITEYEYLKAHSYRTTTSARANIYAMAIYKNNGEISARVDIEQGIDGNDPDQFERLLQKAGKMLDTHILNHDTIVVGGNK